MQLLETWINAALQQAFHEDLAWGDVTTEATVPRKALGRAVAVAKQSGRIAGLPIAKAAFAYLDPEVQFKSLVREGADAEPGDLLFSVEGYARAILMAERTALNFLQRLSGVATLTRECVQRISHTRACVLDTRKTTPGLRYLEKYAVRVGGGVNHRFNLSDGVLIKDNHIIAAGGLTRAIQAAESRSHHLMRVEVEVRTLDEVEEALSAGADVLLLDNMDRDTLRKATQMVNCRALTEASGGVTLETLAEVAECGVDFISLGALTHSAPALDISLQFQPQV